MFRAGKSTTEQIFNLRILCEKYLQHQQNLYHVFIDFKKAFDRVWHAALWATMRKYNINANLVRTIEQLYDKATSAVQINGSIGWLVGCFGFNGPLRQYFSLYRAVSHREGDRRERIDESKNVQTTPTAPTASTVGPCPTVIQFSRRMVQKNSRSKARMSSVTHPLQHFSRTDHVRCPGRA